MESALRETGLSHAILRPAVFFGGRDVLVNNIAWLLRRLPIFGVAPGPYGLQPVHVEDFARLAIQQETSRVDGVLLGAVVRDVVPTPDEVAGLTANLLVSKGPATGSTRFSEWLTGTADELGVRWASELHRHYR